MRLICPNCGAQYEVPDEVIPETGRDVQCSDCGDTWYQYHPDFPPEPETDTDDPSEDWDRPYPEDAQGTVAASGLDEDELTEDYGAGRDMDDEEEVFAIEEVDTVPPPAAAPARRELDPSIRDVLREEALREEQARKAEMQGGLETQQELGIEEPDTEAERRMQEARARMARLRGLPDTAPEEPEETEIDAGSRRNLLPDIDEITSSLGPDRVEEEKQRAAERHVQTGPVEPPEKRGFRLGFRISVVLAVVALLIYVFAAPIAETVPALTGVLSAYVDLINSGRAALAQMVENVAGSLGDASVN